MIKLGVAKRATKTTATQKKATKLWKKYLKGRIVALISSTQGQHRAALARVEKAMKKRDFDIVKSELIQLKKGRGKKRKKGFLIPVFVEREAKEKEAEKYPLRRVKVEKKIYLAPDRKLAKKLQKAWEEFLNLIEKMPTGDSS